MKRIDWTKIKLISAAILPLVFAGCASTTPAPGDTEIGSGEPTDKTAAVDETMAGANGSDGGDATGLGHAENNRMTGTGFKKGKWDAIHFDYDSASIKADDRKTLEDIAAFMKSHSGAKLKIEGHCDERGTPEYNRALGQRRASAAREYLIKLGASPSNIGTISYGEEVPEDLGHDDSAWAKNRRDEFGLAQ